MCDVPGLVLAGGEVDGAPTPNLETLTLAQTIEPTARGGVVQDVRWERAAMTSTMTLPAPLRAAASLRAVGLCPLTHHTLQGDRTHTLLGGVHHLPP